MHESREVIFEWNIANDCLKFSKNFNAEFDYPPTITNVQNWLLTDFPIHEEDKQKFVGVLAMCLQNKTNESIEIQIKTISGHYEWYNARIFLQYDQLNNPINVIGVLSNIDVQKNQLDLLTSKVQTDPLTGILNKMAFSEIAKSKIANLANGESLVMMMLDLDRFKYINDEFGHPTGDYVLIETSKAMRLVFRPDDCLGRLGGDEFAVLINDISDQNTLKKKADQILEQIAKIKINNSDLIISCSIGIATTISNKTSYAELYKHADDALYRAKGMGKGCCEIF